jgi:hypothetical protein
MNVELSEVSREVFVGRTSKELSDAVKERVRELWRPA